MIWQLVGCSVSIATNVKALSSGGDKIKTNF